MLDGSAKLNFPMTQKIKASLLFFFLSLCAGAVIVTHHFRSHRPPPSPRELFAVVEEQLAAFRASDYPSAYRHSASSVQQKFTLPQFEAMIRRDYGDMASARQVEFGLVQVTGSAAVVQVFFRETNGTRRCFLYSLLVENGVWRINGVQAMRPSPRGLNI